MRDRWRLTAAASVFWTKTRPDYRSALERGFGGAHLFQLSDDLLVICS
jgi:hypothetical protein